MNNISNLKIVNCIIEWLTKNAKKHDMYFGDTRIYYYDENNKNHNYVEVSQEGQNVKTKFNYDTQPVTAWLEYCNPTGVNLSFENSLYDIVNLTSEFSKYAKLEEDFTMMLDKFKLYYTLGYAWSMSIYEI